MINPPELDMEAEFDVHCPDCNETFVDWPVQMLNRYEGEAECPEGHHVAIDLYEGP